MLPSLMATDLTPCFLKNASISFWNFGFVVTSVATQRSEESVPAMVAFPAREVRPDAGIRERAALLVSNESWAASTWDRIAEGQMFPGIESWLPWLAEPVSMIDGLSSDVVLIVVEPSRALDRARELVKEEAELAAALAPTWGEQAPVAGEHPALFLDLENIAQRIVAFANCPPHFHRRNWLGRRKRSDEPIFQCRPPLHVPSAQRQGERQQFHQLAGC